MSLNTQERMKALLRIQVELPLAFLFDSFEGPVIDDVKCHWIPLYPESPIEDTYGRMVRIQTGDCYQFILSSIAAYGYLISVEDSWHTQFRIEHSLEYSSKAWILINARDVSSTDHVTNTTRIILSQLRRMSSKQDTPCIGAQFRVQEIEEEENRCSLVHVCPLKYTISRIAQHSSPRD